MGNRVRALLDWASAGPAEVPAELSIPTAQTDAPPEWAAPFEATANYVTVRINEMFLCRQRKWFETSLPMVFTQTELKYGSESITVPFVVGPSLVSGSGQELPQGMLFRDTRVAGVYPYIGDKLCFTVILNRLVRNNHAEQLLGMISKLGAAFDVSAAITPYLRIADVILDGVESLLGLGSQPELGLRQEFDTNAGDTFRPGFYALLSQDVTPPDRLWVRDRRLHVGPDTDNVQVMRDRDYVLYSITRTPRRDDVESLPWFTHLWERIVRQVSLGSADGLSAAITDMGVLGQEIYLSRELTRPQKIELIKLKRQEMYVLHDLAVGNGDRAADADKAAANGQDDELAILGGIVRSMRQRP